jgi:hypothetical protein
LSFRRKIKMKGHIDRSRTNTTHVASFLGREFCAKLDGRGKRVTRNKNVKY